MKQVLLFLMVFCAVNVRGQIITTIAGCDTCSSSDGRLATLTALNDPASGAFDKYGNYYFAQNLGKKVSKIGTDGIIHTIAGTGTSGAVGDGGLATSAHLIAPNAVALRVCPSTFCEPQSMYNKMMPPAVIAKENAKYHIVLLP